MARGRIRCTCGVSEERCADFVAKARILSETLIDN